MNSRHGQLWVAAILIAVGLVALMDVLGVLGENAPTAGGVLAGIGGLVFLSTFVRQRRHWWAVIPGAALASLSVVSWLGPHGARYGGSIFLGSLGLAFWIVYVTSRERWWALVPGGVLLTLGVVSLPPYEDKAWQFFLGLAVTFALVALISRPARQTWAWIPAIAAAAAAGLIGAGAMPGMDVVWPIALILAGGSLLAIRLCRCRR